MLYQTRHCKETGKETRSLPKTNWFGGITGCHDANPDMFDVPETKYRHVIEEKDIINGRVGRSLAACLPGREF